MERMLIIRLLRKRKVREMRRRKSRRRNPRRRRLMEPLRYTSSIEARRLSASSLVSNTTPKI